MPGRKTKFGRSLTLENGEKTTTDQYILKLLANGISIKAACKRARVDVSTYDNWRETNEKFREDADHALSRPFAGAESTIMDVMYNAEKYADRLAAARAYLAAHDPLVWGNKVDMTSNGETVGVIGYEIVIPANGSRPSGDNASEED